MVEAERSCRLRVEYVRVKKWNFDNRENNLENGGKIGHQDFLLFPCCFKGGYLDFSHLTELKNVYITEIYMRKQYKSSKIKNKEITKKPNFFFWWGFP